MLVLIDGLVVLVVIDEGIVVSASILVDHGLLAVIRAGAFFLPCHAAFIVNVIAPGDAIFAPGALGPLALKLFFPAFAVGFFNFAVTGLVLIIGHFSFAAIGPVDGHPYIAISIFFDGDRCNFLAVFIHKFMGPGAKLSGQCFCIVQILFHLCVELFVFLFNVKSFLIIMLAGDRAVFNSFIAWYKWEDD